MKNLIARLQETVNQGLTRPHLRGTESCAGALRLVALLEWALRGGDADLDKFAFAWTKEGATLRVVLVRGDEREELEVTRPRADSGDAA